MIENKKSIWFIELVLRVLAVVSIGFMCMNCWSIYSSYANVVDNPLIPSSIASYKAFPHYFFIAFYIGVLFFIWQILKNKNTKRWYIPVIIVILFESFKFYIYGFLMWMNVFG